MTTEEQLDEDRCVVFNYLPDLVAICMLLPKNPFYPFVRPPHYFPGDDGLFQEFKNYYDGRNHPVSMALVFSVQMLLDTLYIRRAAGIDDLAHMRSFARKIRKEREHFVSTNDMPMPDNMVGFIPGLKGHIEFIDSQLGTDMLYQFKVAKGWGEISRSAIQKDTLWKMNPWLCANALSYAVVDWWSCGADLCSGAGFIQCTMQLWNMLKQTGHLDQTKSDQLMEHLIRLCGHQVFHGAPPKNKFIVRFMLMMGQKPEAFAGNRRKHRDGHNPNDQRGGDRSLRHASGKGVTPDMSEILRLHTSKNGLQKEQITRLHRNSTSPSSYQIVSTEKSAAWDDLLQPLHFTRSLVEAEFPLVTVNFYKIQLLCTAFLRQLWDTLQTDLIRLHQSSADELVENETQLPYVVGWIMQMEGNVLLLAKAAAVMKSMLAGETIRDYLLDIDV